MGIGSILPIPICSFLLVPMITLPQLRMMGMLLHIIKCRLFFKWPSAQPSSLSKVFVVNKNNLIVVMLRVHPSTKLSGLIYMT